MTRTYEEIVAAIPAGAFAQRGRFASKLTFAQRCEILAFYRLGIGRTMLAEAYGIDRRTVTHIQNPKSPHYRTVRDEYKRLGSEPFSRKYVTEDGLSRIEQLKVIEERREEENVPRPVKAANRLAGVHVIRNDYCSYDHRVVVEWRDDGGAGPGWYYQDLDGPAPDMWFNNGGESMLSSQQCFDGMKEVVSD